MIVKSKIKKLNLQYLQSIKRFFSTSNIPNESVLKSYIQYIRKNSHKHSTVDSLNLNNVPVTEEFSPDFWKLSEEEKVQNYSNDYTFTKNISNLDTVHEVKEYLFKNYLQNVIYYMIDLLEYLISHLNQLTI